MAARAGRKAAAGDYKTPPATAKHGDVHTAPAAAGAGAGAAAPRLRKWVTVLREPTSRYLSTNERQAMLHDLTIVPSNRASTRGKLAQAKTILSSRPSEDSINAANRELVANVFEDLLASAAADSRARQVAATAANPRGKPKRFVNQHPELFETQSFEQLSADSRALHFDAKVPAPAPAPTPASARAPVWTAPNHVRDNWFAPASAVAPKQFDDTKHFAAAPALAPAPTRAPAAATAPAPTPARTRVFERDATSITVTNIGRTMTGSSYDADLLRRIPRADIMVYQEVSSNHLAECIAALSDDFSEIIKCTNNEHTLVTWSKHLPHNKSSDAVAIEQVDGPMVDHKRLPPAILLTLYDSTLIVIAHLARGNNEETRGAVHRRWLRDVVDRTEPHIVMGDMNVIPSELVYTDENDGGVYGVFGAGWRFAMDDSADNHTTPHSERRDGPIDHMWVQRHIQVRGWHVERGLPERYNAKGKLLIDHYPVSLVWTNSKAKT